MSALLNPSKDGLANFIFRGTAYSALPTADTGFFYVALLTELPSDDGATPGTEVSGDTYARQSIRRGQSGGTYGFSEASASGQCANIAAVSFPEAASSWGTIVGYALLNHLTTYALANILCVVQLASPKAISAGDIFRFRAGEIKLTLA